jgi:hypothetical protein
VRDTAGVLDTGYDHAQLDTLLPHPNDHEELNTS